MQWNAARESGAKKYLKGNNAVCKLCTDRNEEGE